MNEHILFMCYRTLGNGYSMIVWITEGRLHTRCRSETHNGLSQCLYMIYSVLRLIGVRNDRSSDRLENMKMLISIVCKDPTYLHTISTR